MRMPTSKLGYAISYGFAAIDVISALISVFSSDPSKRAEQRGYILY